jgi:hypothetical protein
MLKRLGAIGAVAGVAALAVGSVGPATGQVDQRGGDDHRIIRVVSTVSEEGGADVGEPGDSLADSFAFSSDLTKHGRAVGHTGVVCTVTSLERGEAQCVGTAALRRGQITVQGLIGEEGPSTFSLAITGGTGAYEGAGGTLVVKELSETRELLTFHVTD